MENEFDIKVRYGEILVSENDGSTVVKWGWYFDLVKYNIENNCQYETNRIAITSTTNENEIQDIVEEIKYMAIQIIALDRFITPSNVARMFIKH